MRRQIFLGLLACVAGLDSAFGSAQLLVNGGFEATSAAPWILAGPGVQVISGVAPNGVGPFDGSQYLTMGNAFGASESAYQTVTLPTNLIAATLNFAYDILSANPLGDDLFNVYLTDTTQTTLQGLDTASSVNGGTGGWLYTTNNFVVYAGGGAISSYAGRSVNIYFSVTTDPVNGGYTSFNIDDVSLTVATTADIPPNDDFTNAIVIPPAGITNAVVNTYASKQTGEPNIGNNAGGHSVWWTWTATSLGTVSIATTGSSFNTLLGIYTGTNVSSLTLVTNNNGFNRATGLAALTFAVSPGVQYRIGLDGYNGQTGVADLIFQFSNDKTAPIVKIASPASGANVTNSSVLVKGTASDNVAVAAVYYQLANADGSNSWQLATGTTSWTATVSNMIPGRNTVNVRAYDTSTNVSKTVSTVLNYVIPLPLTLEIVGKGSVSGAVNGKLFNLGYPYTITALAGTGFRFQGWTGDISTNTAALRFVMTSNLSVIATFVDIAKPALSITSPKPSQRWSNSVISVTGKASDNVGVAAVWLQHNSDAWTMDVFTSNQWANWSANVTLTPGANTVRAYAVDAAGNRSSTNVVNFTYVLSAPLTVRTNGLGSIKPVYNNVLLEISNAYTMTATAAGGYLFSNWTAADGTVVASGPTLKFTMESNLNFTANFVPNPFIPVAGMYQGLFYDADGVMTGTSGFFSAQVTPSGHFTAKFQQGMTSHPVSGQFSLTGGWSTNGLKTWGNTTISLQLDLMGGNTINGTLSNSLGEAELSANRAPFSVANPAPQAGKYTLVLRGTNSAEEPGGNGFGTVTVSVSGSVALSETLGDGTKVASTALESASGQWPLYVPLASGNGMLLGWLTFTNEPDRDIGGWLNWFKPAQATSPLDKAGFTNGVEAIGSAYKFTSGERVLDLTNGYVLVEGGGLAESISNQFTLAANNTITGSTGLRLSIAASTGLFSGTFTNAQGKPSSFGGAVLQKQSDGFGQFLNGAQSAGVTLAPQ